MKYFDQFITKQALDFKFSFDGMAGSKLEDAILEEAAKKGNPQVKYIQVAVSKDMFGEVEEVSRLLGMSKRKFFELSVILGLARANEIIQELDVFEFGRLKEEDQPAPETPLRAVK